MRTRVLAVAAALVAALIVHQYNQIEQLRAAVATADRRAAARARDAVLDTVAVQAPDIQQAMAWLDGYYRDAGGLQRPQGLWIDGHPDYVALTMWIFNMYLPDRVRGASDAEARSAIVREIQRSAEWRAKHRAS